MNNRGVLVKLLLLVSISLTSFCILGLFGIFNSKQIYASVDQVQSTAEEFQRFALHITGPLSELRQLTLTMVMAPDHEMQLQLDKQQRALTRQLDETFQGWQSSKTSPGEKEAFDALRASWEDYKKIKDFTVTKVLGAYREEAFINAIAAENDQFQRVNDQVKSWQQAVIRHSAEINRDANRLYHSALWISVLVIVGMTIF